MAICYLFHARLIRVSCVVLTPILSSGTRVNLLWIYVSCELLFISCPTFVLLWQYLMHVKLQLRNESKVKERVSGFPHMVCLSFIEKYVRNLMLEIDAVSV